MKLLAEVGQTGHLSAVWKIETCLQHTLKYKKMENISFASISVEYLCKQLFHWLRNFFFRKHLIKVSVKAYTHFRDYG